MEASGSGGAGRPTHVRPGDVPRPRLPPAARPNEHPDDRSDRDDAPYIPDQSRTDEARIASAWLSTEDADRLRTEDGRYDLTSIVLDHLDALGIDAPVPIGGDDTLSFARILCERRAARRDPQDDGQRRPGTEYCIGFSSAITRAKELIDRQRTTLGSHERIGSSGSSGATPVLGAVRGT